MKISCYLCSLMLVKWASTCLARTKFQGLETDLKLYVIAVCLNDLIYLFISSMVDASEGR